MEECEKGSIKKSNNEIIACYDGDFIPFYACHNKNDHIKTLEECYEAVESIISSINNRISATHFIGFMTKGKCFRYDIFPNYKGNRKYDKLPDYINEVKQYLIDKYGFKYIEGYEADDLLVSYYNNNKDKNIIVVSHDKDIFKLLPKVFNPRVFKFKFNTEYQSYKAFWTSVVCGDPIDGIKGIPGKGPAAAKTILKGRSNYMEKVLNAYIQHFGEYEGIKEFTKNYLCLKLVDNVEIGEIKVNKAHNTICEQAY